MLEPKVELTLQEKRKKHKAEVKKLHLELDKEKKYWSRWFPRLKRAFHQIEKIVNTINRLETRISKLEDV